MGIDPAIAAGLAYLLGGHFAGVVPIVWLIAEKRNRFIRFHTAQALLQRLQDAGRIDWTRASLDSASVPAPGGRPDRQGPDESWQVRHETWLLAHLLASPQPLTGLLGALTPPDIGLCHLRRGTALKGRLAFSKRCDRGVMQFAAGVIGE
jgi:hypothetical protein